MALGPPLLFDPTEIASFPTYCCPGLLPQFSCFGDDPVLTYGVSQTTMAELGYSTCAGCWVYAQVYGGGHGGGGRWQVWRDQGVD